MIETTLLLAHAGHLHADDPVALLAALAGATLALYGLLRLEKRLAKGGSR